MNVLSLFDGMSCGQQALERAGIKVENYFASEIDKYAMQVTMANYPNTIQLGSVINVDGYSLPKIDILFGGSPCQSFSFAGKRKGMSTKDEQEILTLDHYLELKAEGFEFEGQSYLFWEYMRLLNEVKPKYFLLENVMMGEKWEKILSKAIGVKPIMINSALLSAQNRQRLYWTNIGLEPQGLFGDLETTIEQPKDKGILLKDILETYVDNKFYLKNLNNKRLNQTLNSNTLNKTCLIDSYNQKIYIEKSITISTRVNASNMTYIYNPIVKISKNGEIKSNQDKSSCFTAGGNSGGNHSDMDLLLIKNKREVLQINKSKESNGTQPFQQNRVYDANGLMTCLDTDSGRRSIFIDSQIRRLTPIECERLQTVKDNYTNHVSDSQRYKMLGNGWTVDVIAHIFKHLKQNTMEELSFDQLIINVHDWANDKGLIDPSFVKSQFVKCVEELGETASAISKNKPAELLDGLGDTFVTLIILSLQCGVTPQEALNAAWNEIKDRKGKIVSGTFIKQ